MGLTDIQTKWHVEFRIPVLSLLLLKADATKDLAKYYPLGAGVSSLVGTGDNSSKIIANEVVRTVWVSSELGTNTIIRFAKNDKMTDNLLLG